MVHLFFDTSRGSLSTINSIDSLNANGENLKVIQVLFRHATLKVTMDVQAISDEKRKAQTRVVEMLLPGIKKAAV